MDALIFMCIALVLTIKTLYFSDENNDRASEILASQECAELNTALQEDRVAKVNDSYYEDLNAFSEIINALGFPKKET